MDVSDKVRFLRTRLKEDLLESDLQWSLFIAALSSYKHDTVLRPFPPAYIDTDNHGVVADKHNIPRLEKVAFSINNLGRMVKILSGEPTTYSDPVLDLLHWCLNRNGYNLKICNKDFFSEIKEKTKQQTSTMAPHYIFEVIHSAENESRFLETRGDRNVMYGYHGSHIENFHSILSYGLQSHRSKNALFGEGTYLSSELAISLQYSPHGRGWEHSLLGDRLSCIAVCEMIDHPSWVKCQVKESCRDLKRIGSRAKIAGSEGGEIPETYYVVRNNEAIRVKYLLLYVEKTKKRSQSWFYQHRFAVFIFLYGILLLLIAVYKSKTLWVLAKKYGLS